jgi:hypothetical protein
MKKSHAADQASASPTPNQLKELFTQISSGRVTKDGLQKFLRGSGFQPTLSQRRERAERAKWDELGLISKFFGIEEATKYFGVSPTEDQLAALADLPRYVSGAYRKSMTAVFPLSINDLFRKVDLSLINPSSDRYCDTSSAKVKSPASWRMLASHPVENSTGRSWEEQLAVIPAAYADSDYKLAVPSVRVVVYAMLGHFLTTGEWLYGGVGVRCSDIADNGEHIAVSCKYNDICLTTHQDDYRANDLGLAVEYVKK